MCKLIKSILLIACLLVSLPVASGTCSAAQADTVTIQMQDYLTLKQNFLTLQLNNEKQAMLLAQLKEQLAISQTQQSLSAQDWQRLKQQLTEAQEKTQQLQTQCGVLQQQLTSALQASKTAENGLQNAQASLTELSKAIKAERAAAERRETILKIIAGGAIVYAAYK